MKSSLGSAWNVEELEKQYQLWQQNPESVDALWRAFCEGFALGDAGELTGTAIRPAGASGELGGQLQVSRLLQAYRSLGHTQARINPLEPPGPQPFLELSAFGLDAGEDARTWSLPDYLEGAPMRLADLHARIQRTYCGPIACEYTHIQELKKRQWLEAKMESSCNQGSFSSEFLQRTLRKIIEAESFEHFLHRRFVGQKRFSLEGGETLITALDTLVGACSGHGVQELVLGMSHRGRLNVLANILGKSYIEIFGEFAGRHRPRYGGGDVKYHLGYACSIQVSPEERVELSMMPNPSHLESVNPVVLGKTRGRQRLGGDTQTRQKVLPVLVHGDAAFAGQGIVAETFNLSYLPGYRTGGTLHFIVNNQIGFTTNPQDSRSSRYCTDIAKMLEVPIFHVNGENPRAVAYAVELGLEYRQRFGEDVIIDICSWRKYGHNETDEPSFTQPILYSKIAQKKPISETFEAELIQENQMPAGEGQRLRQLCERNLQESFEAFEAGAPEPRARSSRTFKGSIGGFQPKYAHTKVKTALAASKLKKVAETLCSVPENFSLNRKIARQLSQRQSAFKGGVAIDWSFAEALAFGSLIAEGFAVRLSGQDSERGTFSQRHAAWYDTQNGKRHMPLAELNAKQPSFCVYNSSLSEAAVLGFDFGYSVACEKMLILWEAQYGDFANGAQVHFDQYLAGSESKWGVASSLVTLLPHGYEGAGPEHSNARIDRHLQACAEDNIQVAMLTTPSQYFHILRRQLMRPFRKPLVLMSPKSLLRHASCVSELKDFTHGCFQEILPDRKPPKSAKRVIVCSGKIYYDLLEFRKRHKIKDAAILRLEQLYPLHEELLARTLKACGSYKELVWCQEEPLNMGPWCFVREPLERLGARQVIYAGRPSAASPACGALAVHLEQQEALLQAAFGLKA